MTDLECAQSALGWHGTLVPDVRLFGTRIAVVAAVDDERLRERLAVHPEPMFDPDTLAMWEWPGCGQPPSPVTIAGVIVTDRASRRALRTAVDWRGFASTAVVLSEPVAESMLLDAQFAGVAVLTRTEDGGVSLVQQGAPVRSERSRRQTMDRWVEEHVFNLLPASQDRRVRS